MAELDLALINAALATRTPGARASAFEVVERFVAQETNVARIRIIPDPSSAAGLPPTLIAKWTTVATHLPEIRSEIETHAAVLATMPNAPSPICHGTLVHPEDHTALLLTQDLVVDHDRPESPAGMEALEPTTDAIARVHAFWWNSEILAHERIASPMPRPTRMPQAVPRGVIAANAAAIRKPIQQFLATHDQELSAFEKQLLASLADRWGGLFLERIRDGRSITLIHGDLHLPGNVFLHRETGAASFIDLADCKPGLGPHDVACCLISADTADRMARDTALLRRYHDRLGESGITGYPWKLCVWDYRFAILTNPSSPCCRTACAGSRRRARSPRSGNASASSAIRSRIRWHGWTGQATTGTMLATEMAMCQ